jgi:hypothetical protein
VRTPLALDVREVAGVLLVGGAAGALSGAVVGGIGGRLVMLLLRLTSDPIVLGVTSDDGFEIGRFTLGGSANLVGGMAAAGAANGALYVVLRDAIPARLRAGLWSVFAAAVGGSQVVHADGVDFTLLDPLWLAVVSFVVLPGLAALAVVLLVERWLGEPQRRPRAAVLGVAAALGTVGLVVAALLGAAVVGARRAGAAALLGRLGRAVVPAALVGGSAVAAWYVVDEARRILG